LAIQFAAKMGFTVAAISTSNHKEELAKKLGAKYYIDTSKQNPVQELKKLGGAKILVGTVYDAKATEPLVDGLAVDGIVLTLGLDPVQPLSIHAGSLIAGRTSVKGWSSGHAFDSEECCKFAAEHNIKCMVQTFPLSKVKEAYDLMLSNKAKFRVVITPHKQ
jgi:propanol-preferring alcohol dehydrogenase